MTENPALFVRVSLPEGHFTVPAATAEAGGWSVLKKPALDNTGRPLPPKPREEAAPKKSAAKKAASKPRGDRAAATPPKSEAPAPVDTPKE